MAEAQGLGGERGRLWVDVVGYVLYAAVVAALAVTLPSDFVDPSSNRFILALGLLALWRYGWGGLHFLRSLYYRWIVFPRWRRAADALGPAAQPSHVYLLLTSYRIDAMTTARVYRAALREAMACGAPATLVASIVEPGDERLIRRLFALLDPPAHVDLCIVRIAGTGKRDALAHGLSAISRQRPPAGSIVAVIDGDSILTPGSIRRCASLFALRPKMGALTTDEVPELEGSSGSTRLYREWYRVRFAQRHILMGSMGLSRRVLTLTGRFSVFRAELAVDPSFIRTVESDAIDHWLFGRFEFLTGDDKSTWYHLLASGWELGYVPDVQIVTVEEPPDPNFLRGSTKLMVRWFGNMLRTNARARTIPRRRIGTFVWWALIDQRISMWSSLFGVTAAILASAVTGPVVLQAYVVWIALTRGVQSLQLLTARSGIRPWYPLLLYYNQVYGAAIKVYMLHHLDRQKWTRQGTERRLEVVDWRKALVGSARRGGLALSLLSYAVAVTLVLGL